MISSSEKQLASRALRRPGAGPKHRSSHPDGVAEDDPVASGVLQPVDRGVHSQDEGVHLSGANPARNYAFDMEDPVVLPPSVERTQRSLARLQSFTSLIESVDLELVFLESRSARLLSAPMPAVLDTNWVRSAFDWQLSHPNWKPGTVIAADEGVLKLFMPEPTLEEVFDRLPRFAQQLSTRPQTLESLLVEHWLPSIQVVPMPRDCNDDRVAEITDTDDIPAGHLASLLAPCVLLSNDKGFAPLGVAMRRIPAPVVLTAAATVRTSHNLVRLGMAAPAAPLLLVGGVARVANEKLGLPYWISIPVGAFGGYLGVRWYRRQPEEARARLRDTASEMLGRYADELSAQMEREQQARRILSERVVNPVWPRGLDAIVLRRLAYADQPISAQRLIDEMPPDEKLPVTTVRSILRAHDAAVEFGRGRWMLGYWGGALLLGHESAGA